MEPLVAGEPFVRALEELVATAKQGPAEQLQFDPAAVREEFWRGHCGLALSWPTAAGRPPSTVAGADADSPSKAVRVGFAELPGSPQAYNVGTKSWESLGEGVDPHVPLLGVAGRVGAVAAEAKHPEAVLQLLLWLAGEPRNLQVSTASTATTLFCRGQVKSPQQWTEKPVSPAAAAQYAALTETTLRRPDYLFALRLPGRAEYSLRPGRRGSCGGARRGGACRRLEEGVGPLGRDHPPAGTGRATGRLSAEHGAVEERRKGEGGRARSGFLSPRERGI